MQLRLKKLEASVSHFSVVRSALETKFNTSKHIHFVPPFQEKEVNKYFLHFAGRSRIAIDSPAISLCTHSLVSQ